MSVLDSWTMYSSESTDTIWQYKTEYIVLAGDPKLNSQILFNL
jgi:hypothetical protein